MKLPEPLFVLINPAMRCLLRSPLHGLMSNSLMLITFTGRNSGRVFTTPVRYLREGRTVRCFTARTNQWWKNMRGGADVVLQVAGEAYPCRAAAISDDPARLKAVLAILLERYPADAPYYAVRIDSNGIPQPADLERAAHETIMVEADLNDSSTSPAS